VWAHGDTDPLDKPAAAVEASFAHLRADFAVLRRHRCRRPVFIGSVDLKPKVGESFFFSQTEFQIRAENDISKMFP